MNDNTNNIRYCLNDGEIVPNFTDIHGRRVKKTPFNYPYSFDPFVTYLNEYQKDKHSAVYSDRLYQWDYKKFNSCCQEVFGDTGQYFDSRKPEDIERFLSLYLGTNVKLTAIQKECNVSSGFPLWVFFYEQNNDLVQN